LNLIAHVLDLRRLLFQRRRETGDLLFFAVAVCDLTTRSAPVAFTRLKS
jgi:hypothetical protein